jgi:outer membrane protein assembly factor BamB
MVVGDSLLVGPTHGPGYTFALRKNDGEVAWRARTGGSLSGPLVMGSHVVVVTLTDSLFVMQAASGDIVTRAALGASTAAPLAQADDSTAVLTTPSGSVIAVTIPSGRVAWRHDAARPIFGSPVALRDTIFALTNGCTLWMIPRAAPDAAAPRALGCNSVATPLLTRDGVLVATVGGDIVLYDRSTGERRWERHIGGELRQAPTLVNGRIIAAPVLGPVVSLR